VNQCQQQGISSLSVSLGDSLRSDVPIVPANPIAVGSTLGSAVLLRPATSLQASFELAARQLMDSNPVAMGKKYPDLFNWRAAVDGERGKSPT